MKRKAKKRILLTILVVIALLVSAFFIFLYPLTKMDAHSPYKDPGRYPQYPDYQSEYTQEEHIARLTAITESGAWIEINKQFSYVVEQDNIDSIEVEIVYAFYDKDPEFFLIDFNLKKYTGSHTITGQPYAPETNEAFLFGYILDDEYYIIALHGGQNPWEYTGYADEKKYFGSECFAVEIDGDMTVVFEYSDPRDSDWWWRTGVAVSRTLSEAEQLDYMQYDYLYDDYRKYEIKEPTVE